MWKVVNHINANRGKFNEVKHLKFPIVSHPRGPYNNHIVVRLDTGADVNCMSEKTFKEIFPEVELSVCPHKIQNFGNSIADISILVQFHTYMEFRGEKYLNTFTVTNTNDCPNLLSHGATFRMGVLLPNYPEENIVKEENVPNFTITGTSSNVFQILQDLQLKQYQNQCHLNTMPSTLTTFQTTDIAQTTQMALPITSFRTTTPSASAMTDTMTTKQVNPVHVHQDTSCKVLLGHCAHVHK